MTYYIYEDNRLRQVANQEEYEWWWQSEGLNLEMPPYKFVYQDTEFTVNCNFDGNVPEGEIPAPFKIIFSMEVFKEAESGRENLSRHENIMGYSTFLDMESERKILIQRIKKNYTGGAIEKYAEGHYSKYFLN